VLYWPTLLAGPLHVYSVCLLGSLPALCVFHFPKMLF
jgi:hypothetical protein